MSDTCCVCSKPIEGEVLIARYEGWEKNWHPICFAEAASAEIATLRAQLEQEQQATEEARGMAQRCHRALKIAGIPGCAIREIDHPWLKEQE